MSITGCQLLGKRLTERRLFFQPVQVHFACVFSGISAFVHFLEPLKSCDKLLCFSNFVSVSVYLFRFTSVAGSEPFFYRLRNIKSVLEVTWRSAERNVKSVLEVTWRSAERKHQERVRSYLDAVHMRFLPHPTPHPTPPHRHSQSVLDAVCTWRYYPTHPPTPTT